MADEAKSDDKAAAVAADAAATGEETPKTSATKDDKGNPLMVVKVYAPFQVYFEGDALSLSAVNETGPFDILPHHHNFLCMLVPCDLVIKTPIEEKTIKISRALMHVKAEKVTIFVDV